MHIHLLGIAGTMTAPLAVELVKLGHVVTGSDQNLIYPPVSTLLQDAHIKINSTPITSKIDLCIVGSSYNSFSRCRQELIEIKKLKIKYLPATKYLATLLKRRQNILVAGSFGKTTIASLLSWIFLTADQHPSYFFGGQIKNKIPALAVNSGKYSIIEADESINGLDTQAKFLYYPVNHLILTSADWEHKESYSTDQANFDSFKTLVSRLTSKSFFVYNPASTSVKKLLPFSSAQNISYRQFHFPSKIFGTHNLENINAAATMASCLNIPPTTIKKAVSTYLGVKRRLELINRKKDTYFFDDFAQSAIRVKSAIDSIHSQFPSHQIFVFFEPHASFLQSRQSLVGFKSAFKLATKVILSQIKFDPQIDKNSRVTARHWQAEVGAKLVYLPQPENIITYFHNILKPKSILLHFSSGGLIGLNTLRLIIKDYQISNY